MIPCTLGGSIKATQAFKKESQRTTHFHKSSSAPRAANSFKLFVTSVACRSRTSLNQWPIHCLHPIIPFFVGLHLVQRKPASKASSKVAGVPQTFQALWRETVAERPRWWIPLSDWWVETGLCSVLSSL